MTLLNIFHTGGVTLMLSLVALFLISLFLYQAYKGAKSGGATQDLGKGTQYDNKKIPIYKTNMFWWAVGIFVLYIVAMIFVNSDYKGV